jgi:hypothetical protein
LGSLASGNGIAIDYAELPDAVTGRISNHFGITFSPAEIEKMNAVAGFDAKTPGIGFTPDAEAKRGMASDLVRRLAAERLDPLYEKLRGAAANIW